MPVFPCDVSTLNTAAGVCCWNVHGLGTAGVHLWYCCGAIHCSQQHLQAAEHLPDGRPEKLCTALWGYGMELMLLLVLMHHYSLARLIAQASVVGRCIYIAYRGPLASLGTEAAAAATAAALT